ncbi:MAG: Asp-tRNA(Asn)/Glu-tRNA(Gln) amidotransferase subunit GatC [Burkholderia sp.]|nr:Asp-tRNA(Asn)/Glu-tRNA(Gln) amidotransferase subunit GatC [Burkholderia sp.]
MSLNLTDINYITVLSQLEISDSKYILSQLSKLFDLIEKIQEIDTTGVTPFSHPTEQIQNIRNHFRDDVVTETVNREDNQRSAPAIYNGLYLVPKVIE